jgi:hypothetical protein
MTSSTGPVTAKGKAISSRNATKLGLHAKNWLNDQEQELYNNVLAQLQADYEPVGMLEMIQIERIANYTTRLHRIHQVEDAMYAKARKFSDDPEIFLESMGIGEEDKPVIEKFADFLSGVYQVPSVLRETSVQAELMMADRLKIREWNDFKQTVPELWWNIINECFHRDSSVSEFFVNTVKWPKRIPPYRNKEKTELTEDLITKINDSGHSLNDDLIAQYLDLQMGELIKYKGLLALKQAYEEQKPLMELGAMPSQAELAKVHRERIAAEKIVSTATGELIELQRRRLRGLTQRHT